MSKINKILIGLLLVSCLFLGIGYSAIENITLDIGGTATAIPTTRILVTGENFNKMLKGSTSTSTANTTITKIVFDYWEYGYLDGETQVYSNDDWELGTPIDVDGLGGIRLFKSADGAKLYVLSETLIYANLDCSDMFYHMEGVIELCFNNFDTSKVENMYRFFRRCDAIQTLDVSSFNTENVINMQDMFSGCAKLSNIKGLNKLNTSKVTTMERMFLSDSSLTSLDLSSFNTSNVQKMRNMFGSCENLANINLNTFNTINVQNMEYMFAYCYKLKELDLSSFNTMNVKSFAYMLYQCSALTMLDISRFDTSNATNMNAMFGYLYALKNIDVSHFNTSNVTTMERMFNNSKFETLDLSCFDTSNVTNMKKIFTNNPNLTTIYISDKWTTEKVDHSSITAEEQPFLNCTKLVGGAGTTYNSEHVDISYARIDSGPNSEVPGYLTLKSSTE